MSLPFFGLGAIEPSSFYLAMFALLVVLMIAFASAHAQQVRVQRLAHRGLDRLGDESVFDLGVHPRDLFDALRLPSLIRIAPLAQLFRGLDSSFASPGDVPLWRKRTSAIYYLLLKTVAWFVYFGFPGAALWLTFARTQATGWLSLSLFGAALIATMSLIHILTVDMWYVREVKDIILESRAPSSAKLERPEK